MNKNIVFAFLLTTLSAMAYQTDAEGYPVLYLRGTMTDNAWECNDAYRLRREGNLYSIYLPELSGEFKIATDDWSISYGSDNGTVRHIRTSCTVTGHKSHGGENFVASGLRDVDIWLIPQPNSADTGISFNIASISQPLSGTLPVLYIDVTDDAGEYNDEILDRNLAHKEYFTATYHFDDDAPLPLQIKARGNWTRTGFAKKPFKLKLDKKQALLGLSKSKHFTLLAHADDDRGFMRNFTAFELGRMTGLPWTPAQRPIELIINGDYRGLYFLTESIRVDADRIDITELADEETDPALISGGYIVELDNYEESNQIVMSEKSNVNAALDRLLRVTYEAPEIYSPVQERFVREQFEYINNAVGDASDNMWRALDLDDAVRYYLVEEIVGDREAYQGSTFLFRDRGEDQKWHFSPLWDFGHAFESGHGRIYDTTLYGCTWLASMWQNRSFRAKVLATWKWFMGTRYNAIYDAIDRHADAIAAAAACDHRRWRAIDAPTTGIPICTNPDIPRQRDAVKAYLADRVQWLSTILGPADIAATEPVRDTTPALPLPDYATNVHNVSADVTHNDAPTHYYTLEGIEISRPTAAGIYLERRTDTTHKLLIRH